MNTLTSGFNHIQLSKLNTNLLSVISFVVLCAMIFIPVNAFAGDCDDLLAAATDAANAYADALENYQTAQEALQNALDARPINWDLIRSANSAFDAAEEALEEAEEDHELTWNAYIDCVTNSNNSGSCDSGGCG